MYAEEVYIVYGCIFAPTLGGFCVFLIGPLVQARQRP